MSVNLLTEHHLVFLSLKEGCIGSSQPTFVKMPHCWKSDHSSNNSLIVYYVPTLCVLAGKALGRLNIYSGSSEPLLLQYVKCTKISHAFTQITNRARGLVRPNKKLPVFRVTQPYLNLRVKLRNFFRFSGKYIILCILKGI